MDWVRRLPLFLHGGLPAGVLLRNQGEQGAEAREAFSILGTRSMCQRYQ